MKALKNKKGFTLVELIIVIAILGILAAIAIPRMGKMTDNARAATEKSNIKMLNNLSATYYADKGVYIDAAATAAGFKDFVDELETAGYLEKGIADELKDETKWTGKRFPTYTKTSGVVALTPGS